MKKRGESQFPDPNQGSLFDATAYDKPEPQMDYDPAAWATRADITYHGSREPQMPGEQNIHPDTPPRAYGEPPRPTPTNYGYGFHHGDLKSAMDRSLIDSPSQISADNFHNYNMRPYIHPLRQSGEMALMEEQREPRKKPFAADDDSKSARLDRAEMAHPLVHDDSAANIGIGTELVGKGQTVPYVNAVENPESISFRSPRSNISTWAEDVAADPGASREHRLMAEQFDLTIPAKQNWVDARLSNQQRPNAKALPGSLSGQVVEQPGLPGLGGDTQVSGQSELTVLKPRMKRKKET